MTTSYNERLQRLRETVPHIDVDEAVRRIDEGAVLLDVREPDETAQGIAPEAVVIPRGLLEMNVSTDIPDLDTPVVVYCASGVRSLFATEALRSIGYSDVSSLDGGFDAWKSAGQPIEVPRQLNPAQSQRYSRHLRIPEIGVAGQQKLLESRVLLIGAGGLGSPAGLYFAAAGVGTIGVIDDDVVDASNLQRQILHRTHDLGSPKVQSARRTMEALNPDVQVVPHQVRLSEGNVREIFSDYDLIVDGSDSFETRYIVNDACVALKIPQVHGSIFRFDGQITSFDPRQEDSPCYRCLFPSPPPPELAPNCAVAGVLGVLPGVVGTIQATEAIKLLLGIGEPLVGRLLMYDALAMTFRTLKVRRDPGCPACGMSTVDVASGSTPEAVAHLAD